MATLQCSAAGCPYPKLGLLLSQLEPRVQGQFFLVLAQLFATFPKAAAPLATGRAVPSFQSLLEFQVSEDY